MTAAAATGPAPGPPTVPPRWGSRLALPALSALLGLLACGHPPTAGSSAPATPPSAVPLTPAQFADAIPRCAAAGPTVSTHDAREREPGTKVLVAGMLVHNPKWDCPAKACAGKRPGAGACCNACTTPWFIVDAAQAARPYMSRSRLYLRERGKTEPLALTARDCDVGGINAALPPRRVVVAGTFHGSAGRGGGSYLLGDVILCTPR